MSYIFYIYYTYMYSKNIRVGDHAYTSERKVSVQQAELFWLQKSLGF